jgi:hypothetical protein
MPGNCVDDIVRLILMENIQKPLCNEMYNSLFTEVESSWKSCCTVIVRAVSRIRDHIRSEAV